MFCVARKSQSPNETILHLRLQTLRVGLRTDHPYRRVFCHPYDVQDSQVLCGHHKPTAGNHRTLWTFSLHNLSWEAGTEPACGRRSPDEVTLSARGGTSRSDRLGNGPRGSDLPYHSHGHRDCCNGRRGSGHRDDRHGVHHDDSCRGRSAAEHMRLRPNYRHS